MNRQEKFIISLSVALLLVAFMAYKIIPEIISSLRPKGGNFIGMVLESKGEIKMRFGESVNWKPARKKDRIYSKVYLFTGDESSASFAFLDESSLNLGPNSLIYIDLVLDQGNKEKKDEKNNQLAIELVDGQMQVDLKSNQMVKKLKIDDASIDISKGNSVVKLNYNENNGMEVSVMKGDINISTKENNFQVKHGEKIQVSKNESNSKVEPIPADVLEEMKKMSESDRRAYLEEMQRKRGLAEIAQQIADLLSGEK
jgi:FecR protein